MYSTLGELLLEIYCDYEPNHVSMKAMNPSPIMLLHALWKSINIHFIDAAETIEEFMSLLYMVSDSHTRQKWRESLPYNGAFLSKRFLEP